MSSPPTIGPRAMPAPLTAVQIAMALARSRVAEGVDEDGQRRRHDERPADAHDAAAGDEHRGGAGEGAEHRAGQEDEQAGGQRVASAEPVTEASCGQQQPGEHDGVGGHDPLELGGAGVEVHDDLRKGDVDDRVVDRGDEQGDHEHAEDAPAVRVARRGLAEVLVDRTTVHDCSFGWLPGSTVSVRGPRSHWAGPLRSARAHDGRRARPPPEPRLRRKKR